MSQSLRSFDIHCESCALTATVVYVPSFAVQVDGLDIECPKCFALGTIEVVGSRPAPQGATSTVWSTVS